MKRALTWLAVAVVGAGCWNFQALLDECADGGGACGRDGGGGGGSGGGTGGGGGSGGGTGGGGGGVGDGGSDAGALCERLGATGEGVGATDVLPDGGVAFCFNGFQWENPLPQGNSLFTVHGRSLDDVWAAGAGGTLMHWDGTRWRTHQGVVTVRDGQDQAITGLRFLPDGGGWLVGRGLVPHAFTGTTWTPVVTNRQPADWYVGALGVSADGRLSVAVDTSGVAFAAPDWTPLPGTAALSSIVRSVAVSDDGGCLFSGSNWSGLQQADVRFLRSCDGAAELEVGTGGLPGPLWHQRDGGLAFGDLDTLRALLPDGGSVPFAANLQDPTVFLAAAPLDGPSEGYVVGTNKHISRISDGGQLPLANAPGPEHTFFDVVAFPDGGAWVVGEGGALASTGPGGFAWRERGYTQRLAGLLVDDTHVVAVGQDAIFLRPRGATTVTLGSVMLSDVTLSADGGLLVASANGSLYLGIASTPLGAELRDLCTTGSGKHWVVGAQNLIATNTMNGVWSLVTTLDAGPEWWKVDGQGDFVVAVGEGGAIARFRGLSPLGPLAAAPMDNLYGAWVEDGDAGTAWLVGSGPGAWRLAGDAVFDVSPTGISYGTLYDVWGFDGNDVWAVGENGLAVHWQDGAWTRVETGTRNRLERVMGRRLPSGQRELWLVGEQGTVLRYLY